MTAEPIDLLTLDSGRRIGGAEVCLERLVRRLDRSRILPTVACPPGSALLARVQGAGIPALPWIPTSRTHRHGKAGVLAGGLARPLLLPVASALAVTRLASWCSARPRALVHANTFQAAVIGAAVAAVARRPLVVHDRILKKHGALERAVFRRARIVIAPSRTAAEKWGGLFRAKTRVLIDGTDVETFAPSGDRSFRGRVGAAPADLVVTSVSRLSPEKRIEVLIEAAALLPKPVLLLIAGEPFLSEDAAYVRGLEVRAKRLAVRARFIGFVDDVPRLLEASDIIALPSPNETFGQVALEAMAMSVPVVAARAGGPTEIVEEGRTGLLFRPDDAGDLAAKIADLAGDARRRKAMGAEGRRTVLERFTLERTVEEFTRIVTEVAAPGVALSDKATVS
jgi:glycosyltransferase involved in cell wall biosynthesis